MRFCGGGLQAAGIELSAADQERLTGGALGTEETREILGRFSTEASEQITGLVRDAFTTGMNQSYWLALALAMAGMFVALRLDEKKLIQVDR